MILSLIHIFNNREDTPINFPLIRYADVLLMLAECYNQTDQQTKAVEKINQDVYKRQLERKKEGYPLKDMPHHGWND